ncbi:MAG: hypothetical protein KAR18_11690, partial [Spirochaetes bacterium]|nr:hypothetical protein [Spirochaetota bacterium]
RCEGASQLRVRYLKIMNKMILVLLLVLIGTIATLFWAPVDSSWISAIIVLAALLVSIISAFKLKMKYFLFGLRFYQMK